LRIGSERLFHRCRRENTRRRPEVYDRFALKRSFSRHIAPTCRSSFPKACWQTRSRNRSPKRSTIRGCDVADGCYRLEQGLLKVSIASPRGDERILTILGPGSIVGELAIIDGLPRSATVVAIRDCKLSFISREAFLGCYENIRNLQGSRLHPGVTPARGRSCDGSSKLPDGQGPGRARCSNLRSISVARRNPDELSSSTRSGRATSRQWRALRAKT